jgi:hypothetical protein
LSKQIAAAELATIVTRLLTDTQTTGELDGFESFQGFMTDIAKVVCNYCGGEVQNSASPFEDTWYVGIHGSDSLPSAFGGIWREFDPEGSLFDDAVPKQSEAVARDHQRRPGETKPDAKPATYPYLDISTAHISQETMDFLNKHAGTNDLGLMIASYEYGVWVNVPGEAERDTPVPADLRAVLEFAKTNGCSIVRFDTEGETCESLQAYDW